MEKKGQKKTMNGTFMRKGKTGNWREHFTPELENRFKEWETKWLRGSGLKFEYDEPSDLMHGQPPRAVGHSD